MANRKRAIPQYGTVTLNGLDYYRTRVQDADGKLVALYARTPEELYDKELNALEQIDNDTFCRKSPTVEMCIRDRYRPDVKVIGFDAVGSSIFGGESHSYLIPGIGLALSLIHI